MRKVWFNGRLIPENEAKLSIYDSSLMYGDMAFEMMRTFNKRTFKLKEHISRLSNSIEILEIPVDYTEDEIFEAHEKLLAYHIENFPEEEEWRTLINVSRGILPIYQDLLEDDGQSNVIIACFPLRYVLKNMSWVYSEGVDVIVTSQRALPEYLLDPKIKSRSRQHYKMADLQVKRYDPEAWALLLDTDGFIAEGTGSNFFIVKDDRLYTPEGRNCLRGISRQFIMDLSWDCVEKNLTLYDAITADEAFFTCTPYAIVPIHSINGHELQCVGEMTKYLTDKWIGLQKCDFVLQAKRWDQ
jgi:branched-chain amino acid aminotransferase